MLAVVNPLVTSAPERVSRHCTFASKTDAVPLATTARSAGTVVPVAGRSTQIGARSWYVASAAGRE